MTFRPFTAIAVLVVTSSCASESEIDARMSRAAAQVEADVDAAQRCAVDLRALLDRSPASVHAALANHSGARDVVDTTGAALPAALLRERTLAQLSRRERFIEASRNLVAAARTAGTAALDRVRAEVEASGSTRRQLCRARDEALAFAGRPSERSPAGEVAPGTERARFAESVGQRLP
ncbi:MAG TPA: hypothetical protein VF841_17585 [Anaeromyxobacter sp.]